MDKNRVNRFFFRQTNIFVLPFSVFKFFQKQSPFRMTLFPSVILLSKFNYVILDQFNISVLSNKK